LIVGDRDVSECKLVGLFRIQSPPLSSRTIPQRTDAARRPLRERRTALSHFGLQAQRAPQVQFVQAQSSLQRLVVVCASVSFVIIIMLLLV
jgi:hypothetical protein